MHSSLGNKSETPSQKKKKNVVMTTKSYFTTLEMPPVSLRAVELGKTGLPSSAVLNDCEVNQAAMFIKSKVENRLF